MVEVKIIKSPEREAYVPADVTVIEIAAQGIICTSNYPLNDGGTY